MTRALPTIAAWAAAAWALPRFLPPHARAPTHHTHHTRAPALRTTTASAWQLPPATAIPTFYLPTLPAGRYRYHLYLPPPACTLYLPPPPACLPRWDYRACLLHLAYAPHLHCLPHLPHYIRRRKKEGRGRRTLSVVTCQIQRRHLRITTYSNRSTIQYNGGSILWFVPLFLRYSYYRRGARLTCYLPRTTNPTICCAFVLSRYAVLAGRQLPSFLLLTPVHYHRLPSACLAYPNSGNAFLFCAEYSGGHITCAFCCLWDDRQPGRASRCYVTWRVTCVVTVDLLRAGIILAWR